MHNRRRSLGKAKRCTSNLNSGVTPLPRVIRNLRIVPDANNPDHVPVEPVEEAVPVDEDLAEAEFRELRDHS